MSETERPSVYVHLLPGLIPAGTLRGGVAVVIDALRATTVMVRALSSGCVAIMPCAEIDEATALAASLPARSSLLAGERQGLPIPEFDLGNSPDDFTPEVCRGKTLVMTTTNGTRAILATLEADEVGIAALSNARAATEWAATWGRDVHVVCAGTDGRISWEDAVVAGAVADRLHRHRHYDFGNDEGMIAVSAFGDSALAVKMGVGGCDWPAVLAQGRGGRRVRQIGLVKDIDAAGRRDVSVIVPVLARGPIRLVAATFKKAP